MRLMLLPADDSQVDAALPDDAVTVDSDGDPDELAETDLSSLLDLQDQRHESESKSANRVILRVFGGVVASILLWYAVSPTNRRKVDGLIQNVKESRQDLDEVSSPQKMVSAYDEALAKLGSRSTDIDAATRSLGVDPTTVKEDGMDAEMKGMMGGQGRTVGERKRAVEALAGLAGVHAGKPAAPKEAEVPMEATPPGGAPPDQETVPPVDSALPTAPSKPD